MFRLPTVVIVQGLPTVVIVQEPCTIVLTFAATQLTQRRNAHRSLEKQERQYHAPLADRSVEAVVAPPFIVAVVGPAGVGKTTIIKSLVKHWTKQNIAEAMGPVTVVTGKKRRLSLIECPNDLNAMCDLAKVADLVLLVGGQAEVIASPVRSTAADAAGTTDSECCPQSPFGSSLRGVPPPRGPLIGPCRGIHNDVVGQHDFCDENTLYSKTHV